LELTPPTPSLPTIPLATAFTPTEASPEGTRALNKALKEVMTTQGKEGFSVEIADDNIYKWFVKLYGFEVDSQIHQDLFLYSSTKPGRDHVLMEVIFPRMFPQNPPFMRIVYPRFHQYTGHITIGGSICVKELTKSGWSPDISLWTFFQMIRSLLLEGSALVDMDNLADYTAEEAHQSFERVARAHGWEP